MRALRVVSHRGLGLAALAFPSVSGAARAVIEHSAGDSAETI